MPRQEPTIEIVLNSYLYKEDIQQLLAEIEEPVTGTKEELIVRLLRSEDFDESEAVAFLDKSQLQQLCEELELSTQGRRDELFGRVLNAISEDRGDDEPDASAM